jgi:YD repeat-containing protein
VGNPINLTSGNKFHQEVDFRHSSLTRLASARTYNSQVAYYSVQTASQGRFGSIWRSNFDRRLHPLVTFDSDGTYRVFEVYAVSSDGEELAFSYSNVHERFDPMYWDRISGRWREGLKGAHRQMFLVDDQLELVAKDGTRERYSLEGRLLRIDYRDGYRLTLEYDEAGNNTSVSDSFGNAIHFTYGEDGLVTAMADPDGRTTRFTYRYAGFHEELFGEGSLATTHFTHVIETVIYPDDTPADPDDNPVKLSV